VGESLDPSPLARLAALRPDWSRTVSARRIAAAALVVLAAVAAMRSDPHGDHVDVVVALRDLSPGAALTDQDIGLQRRPATTVPDGAQVRTEQVLGATITGAARRGEVLTDVRLLGSRAAEAAAGPDARIVPLDLPDTALLDLIRAGDVVDVLAADTTGAPAEDARPHVIAAGAVVVLVSEKKTGPGAAAERVVLLALPARSANEVAGAGLTQAVTLTFH
jgi:hypothetical protein